MEYHLSQFFSEAVVIALLVIPLYLFVTSCQDWHRSKKMRAILLMVLCHFVAVVVSTAFELPPLRQVEWSQSALNALLSLCSLFIIAFTILRGYSGCKYIWENRKSYIAKKRSELEASMRAFYHSAHALAQKVHEPDLEHTTREDWEAHMVLMAESATQAHFHNYEWNIERPEPKFRVGCGHVPIMPPNKPFDREDVLCEIGKHSPKGTNREVI
jgi:hypothetical protein